MKDHLRPSRSRSAAEQQKAAEGDRVDAVITTAPASREMSDREIDGKRDRHDRYVRTVMEVRDADDGEYSQRRAVRIVPFMNPRSVRAPGPMRRSRRC